MKGKTISMFFISDSKENVLACSESYNIAEAFSGILKTFDKAEISTHGLFLNIDARFDSKAVRAICQQKGNTLNVCKNKRNTETESDSNQLFDEELYKNRFVIERSNASLDA